MNYFQGWELLAGLGIFLFAIYLLEESIKDLSGKTFRKLIKNYTSNRFNSFFTGTLVTGILQSSSAVSLLIIAFVGAGIMQLSNAIGVMIGANLGTSITAWIVAFFGFTVKIETISLPIIGVGGLGLIFFGKSKRLSNISKLLFSFGLLFMGLDYMKSSVEELTQFFDLSDFRDSFFLIFVVFGIVATAVMQSSSAVIAITLTALQTSIISFNDAAFIVIGANIGTTITVMIGTIGGSKLKKRVALSHLIFNVMTGLAALALFIPLTNLVVSIIDANTNAVLSLALFHTSFNLLGAILFIPFLSFYANFINKIIEDKKKIRSVYLTQDSNLVADAAEGALKNEIMHVAVKSFVFISNVFKINVDFSNIIKEEYNVSAFYKKSAENQYRHLKSIEIEAVNFTGKIADAEVKEHKSYSMLHSLRQIIYATKSVNDISHNLDILSQSDDKYIIEIKNEFRNNVKQILELLVIIL